MTFTERRPTPIEPASLHPNWRLRLPMFTLTARDVTAFAEAFDAQPMHLDPEAARSTPLRGLAASGWQTCAATMAAIDRELDVRGLSIDRFGVDSVVWAKPVRPDSALTGNVSFLGAETCSCSPRSFAASVEVTDCTGEIVMRWSLLGRLNSSRAGGAAVSPCLLDTRRPSRSARHSSLTGLKFFEEVTPGEEIDLGAYTLSLQRCQHFLTHIGAGARGHPHAIGGHAPEWLVAAAWMHCIVRYYVHQSREALHHGRAFPRLGPAAGLRHLRWHRRVEIDQTLAFRAWAERKIEIASAEWGLLIAGAEVVDASGELVASFYPQLLLERCKR